MRVRGKCLEGSASFARKRKGEGVDAVEDAKSHMSRRSCCYRVEMGREGQPV